VEERDEISLRTADHGADYELTCVKPYGRADAPLLAASLHIGRTILSPAEAARAAV
jgi:hypothetical protein